jgi:phage N-6-adenine-methyltransferase
MSALAGFVGSGSDEFPTPADLFHTLDREFWFVLDAAASPSNAKCGRYFTKDDDGLARSWAVNRPEGWPGAVFLNPPYGRGITERWLDKGWREMCLHGCTVVMLVPAAVGSKWWVPLVVERAAEIRFVSGRLRFEGAPRNAPFDCAVVIFRPVELCDIERIPIVSWIGTDGRPLWFREAA